MPLLELSAVEARYGAIKALHGINLAVDEGEIVSILGANGAGKTTTLRAISGTVRTSGNVVFAGGRLRGGPEGAARRGIAHVPEGRGTFTQLTVAENLRLGAHVRRDRGAVRRDVAAVFERFPVLADRQSQRAGLLSGGEQQQLAIARALMSGPRLLLLDEPTLGLAPKLVRLVFDLIARLRDEEGVTILLVEQNVHQALACCDRAYLMRVGSVETEGTPEELRRDRRVQAAYLGVPT